VEVLHNHVHAFLNCRFPTPSRDNSFYSQGSCNVILVRKSSTFPFFSDLSSRHDVSSSLSEIRGVYGRDIRLRWERIFLVFFINYDIEHYSEDLRPLMTSQETMTMILRSRTTTCCLKEGQTVLPPYRDDFNKKTRCPSSLESLLLDLSFVAGICRSLSSLRTFRTFNDRMTHPRREKISAISFML
jgi:hypothetical protein